MIRKITPQYINTLLINEDIEGYIAFGAPKDEYASEARIIADAVAALSYEQFTQENIIAIIASAWATFELSPDDLKLRLPSIQRVAEQIMHNHLTASRS